MSSPDDTWWNPRTQRWEPGPEPARPGEPEHPAGPGHPGRPGHPQDAAWPRQPEPSAEQRRPEEASRPAQEPGRSAQPTASEAPTQAAGPGQPAQPAWYEQPAGYGWASQPAAPDEGLPPLPPPPRYDGWAPQPVPPPLPPQPPHGPGGRAQQWRTPLLVGLAAAVVGGASVAAWMLLGGKDQPAADARPPARSGPSVPGSSEPFTSPPANPAPSRSPSGSPSPSASPGYTVVRNEAGFSVAVPSGWGTSHDEQGNGAFYRPPGGDRSALIQIFRITEPASTGSCELLRMSSDRLNSGTPAYRQVSIDPVAGSACELVYEYDSAESHGRRRGMERIVTTPDGNRWALLAAGPATDGLTTRANLTAAVESFRPE
ncbi:hypothetical protein AB0F18_22015 [Streptomyces sp. NPDC029216]|uniref:hypothetical protein n=1 Tax=Streptomyces sp. NPDC029216 TaxID=3154701 RepID=UPI0033C9A33B